MAAGDSVDDFTGIDGIPMGEGRTLNLFKAKHHSLIITRADGSTITLKNFQDGDMVSSTKTNDKITAMSDPQCGSAASVTYDGEGNVVVNVQQGGTANNVLSDIYNTDEVVGVHSAYGDEISGGDHCMIKKSPDAPFGKSVPIRAWTFEVFDYKYDGNRNSTK